MTTVTYAVTTRSHLKSVRFFVPMWRASARIRDQLAQTPGCLRFASMVMGPREFWTLTVWRTRQEMLDFMRSGAHEEFMWRVTRWMDSFWLMRWSPSSEEAGDWSGLSLSSTERPVEPEMRRSKEQELALRTALDSIPRLRAAAAAHGAPTFDTAPSQRRSRARVAGGVGATLRLELPGMAAPAQAWLRLRRLRRQLLGNDDVLRCAFGMARPNELFLLAVLRNERIFDDFVGHPEVARLRARWPGRVWTMRWDAVNEFGHWDHLRLRKVKLGTAIDIPEEARSFTSDPKLGW